MEQNLKPVQTAAGGILLSVVVPAFNEQAVLHECHSRLSKVLDALGVSAEIVFVNDGSTDNTPEVLYRLREQDPRVAVVELSRNFGKEIALTAGLDHAQGEAVVVIDADLQDPPELIPELIKQWREGYDVVYATRVARDGETYLKKATAGLFYRREVMLRSRRRWQAAGAGLECGPVNPI